MYRFRRSLLGATALVIASASSAISADLAPVVKAPPLPLIHDWTGFYFGAHAGVGIAAADSSTRSDVVIEDLRASGARGGIYGVHGGYNWQIGRAVLGVEVDWSGTGLEKTNHSGFLGFAGNTNNKIDWLASARGRIGFVADVALVYATMGAAFARSEFNGFSGVAPAGFQTISGSTDSVGLVYGGGVEVALGRGFSARAEYLRYVFGDSLGPTRFAGFTSSDIGSYRLDSVDVIRAGITYHPFQRAPVAASNTVYNWAGFYLGGHVGYGVASAGTSVTDDIVGEDLNASGPRGAAYGAQLGYNWQFGRAVVGIEADWTGLSASSSNSSSFPPIFYSAETELKWLASLRGRVGITANQLLLYATFGVAWADVEFNGFNGGSAAAFRNLSISKTDTGVVFGAGAEWALGNGFSLRAEYLRYAFGTTTGPTRFNPTDADEILLGRLDSVDVVRLGASYHFHHAARPATQRANWNGFYVGGHAGYAVATASASTFDDVISEHTTAANPKGGAFGIQVGVNRQFNWLVVGLEADVSWVDASRSATYPLAGVPPYEASMDIKNLASLRGRAGVAADNLMVYVTAGGGWVKADARGFHPVVPAGSQLINADYTELGLTFGAGAEWSLNDAFSVRAEYLRYVFGASNGPTAFTAGAVNEIFSSQIDSVDVVRVGLNHRFGGR